MNNKELIIHLIREQIRNMYLMHSLENLGFDCSAYTLSISQEILDLAGFSEKPDKLYQWYFNLIDKSLEETSFLNLDEMMNKWSLNIYAELLEARLKEGCSSR